MDRAVVTRPQYRLGRETGFKAKPSYSVGGNNCTLKKNSGPGWCGSVD